MLTEKEIIKILTSTLGLSDLDDVSVVGLKRSLNAVVVFKSDMLVQSTDIPPEAMQPWQIARKSVVSCVSDLSAKGARPVAAMISLGLPKNCDRPFVSNLAQGFKKASDEFGVKIVGGDTNEAGELVIDCSMIGIVEPANNRVKGKVKIPTRSGARVGDAVIVSGKFGYPPSGLKILMENARARGKFKQRAVQSVTMPIPRQNFGMKMSRYFSSSIDSSDGLAISLYELAIQSSVDITINKIPYADGVQNFAKENDLDVNELVFHGGEEYQIVATIPQSETDRAESMAKRSGLELYIIGKVTGKARQKEGKVFIGGDEKKILANRGYLHFKSD